MNKTLYVSLILFFSSAGLLFSQFSLSQPSIPDEPSLELSLDQESYSPGDKVLITVKFTFPDSYHQTYDPVNFKLAGEKTKGALFGSTLYPEGKSDEYGNIQYYGSAELSLEMMLDTSIQSNALSSQITAYYQLCDDNGICYFPQSKTLDFSVPLSDSNISGPVISTLWFFMAMALLGGFLLNLMPCVLPLLSVKAMNLISQSGEKRSVLVRHGLLYTSGILVSFWILSTIILVLQHSGRLLGWGFHFQSPLFLSILISSIFLFALSLFEVFILIPPSSGMNKADSFSRKKGYTGSFFTGIFAVFIATPCTAPFLGTAMGFAFTQTGPVIFLIMSLTGLGLAFPFLLLGFFPGFFKLLPRPGVWMDKFREAMAFLLMGTVVYLCGTLIHQIGIQFISMLWFLLILAASAWIWGWSMKKSRKKLWRAIFILGPIFIILVSGFQLLNFDTEKIQSSVKSGSSFWEDFDSAETEKEIRNGVPLLLAFSADWCTSCKVNERTVFDTERTRSLFKNKNLKTIKADLTVSNPEAMKWIYKYGRAGVPLYLLFLPGQEVRILPEILTYRILEDALLELK